MRRILAFVFVWTFVGVPLGAETWLVLPLSNQTMKPSLDWIGESAAESVSEALIGQGLLVIDRENRMEGERRLALRAGTRWTRASVLKLAETLDADYVLFGTYDLASPTAGMGTIRFHVDVFRTRELYRGAQLTETGPLEELARLEQHLCWQVLNATSPQSAPGEQQYLSSRRPLRVDAMENYIRGLLATTLDARERHFQQALRLDPKFSQAAFQYGRLLFGRRLYTQSIPQFEKVQPGGSHYREAIFLSGLARLNTKDFAGAERAFDRVLREVPLSEVYNNLALAQHRLENPQAIENLRKALEGDDKDPTYHFNLGLVLAARGALSEAAAEFRAVLDRDPGDQEATKMLGRCLRPPGPTIPRSDLNGLERAKLNFDESAWLQLKALTSKGK